MKNDIYLSIQSYIYLNKKFGRRHEGLVKIKREASCQNFENHCYRVLILKASLNNPLKEKG
jgi:hypothetical protein